MALMGLDVGSTGCKAVVFDLEGNQLARAYREYPEIYPNPGWIELDPARVMRSVEEVIAEAAAAVGGVTGPDAIRAISISAMGETFTPVAKDGTFLYNSIVSPDNRAVAQADAWQETLGPNGVFQITGMPIHPSFTLPKIQWFAQERPEIHWQVWKYLLWPDLIAFKLGLTPRLDYSLAGRTMAFDVVNKQWAPQMLEPTGLSADLFAEPIASGEVVGELTGETASRLGLAKGCLVVAGGHDQPMNALGAGIIKEGLAVDGMGTVECITPAYDGIPDARPMLACGLNVEHSLLPDLYVSFLYNQSGVLVRWFRDTFAAADKRLAGGADIYDALTAEMPADPTRLLVLPHFEITGAPHYIADSAGVIAGLTTGTTRGEILKAIIESATFYFVEPLDALKSLGIDTSEFVATGGGARSNAWLQIKADILGVPFVRPKYTECGVLGAAMLAGAATGVFANVAEAAQAFVRRDRAFEPNPERHRIYRDRYAHYQRLYPAMKDLLADMQAAP